MLPFFPRDVLDEISDLIDLVSEGFPTYSCKHPLHNLPASHVWQTNTVFYEGVSRLQIKSNRDLFSMSEIRK